MHSLSGKGDGLRPRLNNKNLFLIAICQILVTQVPGKAITFHGTPAGPVTTGELLGESTDAILQEIGFGDEIESLKRAGVLQSSVGTTFRGPQGRKTQHNVRSEKHPMPAFHQEVCFSSHVSCWCAYLRYAVVRSSLVGLLCAFQSLLLLSATTPLHRQFHPQLRTNILASIEVRLMSVTSALERAALGFSADLMARTKDQYCRKGLFQTSLTMFQHVSESFRLEKVLSVR